MLNTLASIVALLEGTLLEGQTVIQLDIPESSDCAFAIAVAYGQDIAAGNLMRSPSKTKMMEDATMPVEIQRASSGSSVPTIRGNLHNYLVQPTLILSAGER